MGARQGAEAEEANIGAAKDCADESAVLMEVMRRSLGMLIPYGFHPRIRRPGAGTLLDTLHDCEHFLPWEHVVLVVDGDARSYAVVQNLGSLSAAPRTGVRCALQR